MDKDKNINKITIDNQTNSKNDKGSELIFFNIMKNISKLFCYYLSCKANLI